MSTPTSGHPGDESLKNRDATPAMESIISRLFRPDYYQLKRFYHHVEAEGLLQKPIDRKHVKAWANAHQDFEDALFELLPRSGLGAVILDPADTRTEQARVTNAAITLHDWLRLYQEILKQPPPKGLETINEILCERRDDLNRQYPPATHQPD